MNTIRLRFLKTTAICLAFASQATLGAGHLQIEKAWIRTAPPGAMMLAGYASVRNDGDAPVSITGASSDVFGDVSLHESISENGMEHMRALGDIIISPGASVVFAPAGKHFMLMQPKRQLKAGDSVKIHLDTKSGEGTSAEFVVRETAP